MQQLKAGQLCPEGSGLPSGLLVACAMGSSALESEFSSLTLSLKCTRVCASVPFSLLPWHDTTRKPLLAASPQQWTSQSPKRQEKNLHFS